MSLAKLAKLELMIDLLERRLNPAPDYYVLHEPFNGEPDLERFKRDYGCTLEEVSEKGRLIVTQVHFARDKDE